jgi:hypothetical protein
MDYLILIARSPPPGNYIFTSAVKESCRYFIVELILALMPAVSVITAVNCATIWYMKFDRMRIPSWPRWNWYTEVELVHWGGTGPLGWNWSTGVERVHWGGTGPLGWNGSTAGLSVE